MPLDNQQNGADKELSPRHFRVFLSSPGDVSKERRIVEDEVQELAKVAFLRGRVTFDVISWDDPNAPTPMPANLSPQEAVIRFSRRPAECEIVIVVLWSRLGTHLDTSKITKPNGEPYLSGTEWEYEDAANADPPPDILLYRRTEKPRIDIDDPEFDAKKKQYDLVNTFLARFRNPDGSFAGSVTDYAEPDALAQRLVSDLSNLLNRRIGAADAAMAEQLATREREANKAIAAKAEAERRLHQVETDKGVRKPSYSFIVRRLLNGAVVPFLGPGASVFHRNRYMPDPGSSFPPTTLELADRLAAMAQVPDEPNYWDQQSRLDLARIASYVEFVALDRPGLRDYLRPVFNRDYTLNELHHTLAAVARHTPLLIITTNYDDMIERAFQTAEPEPLPYHLVVTAIEEEAVKYQRPSSNKLETVDPQLLTISFNNASIIYKMHGSINRHRDDNEEDYYVITEEDRMNFIGRMLVPHWISTFTMTRRFLFIGYDLQNWYNRFMLSQMFQVEARRERSWAILYDQRVIEKLIWQKKSGVDIFEMDLYEFSNELSQQIQRAGLR